MKYSGKTLLFAVTMLLVLMTVSDGIAQEKTKKKEKKQEEVKRDNSFSPWQAETEWRSETSKKEVRKKRKMRKKDLKNSFRYNYRNMLDQKKEEFYKRMKKNAKEDRKMAREMKKPQYSDPMYFGHKRKPKKRPVGKRKFCKECGIVH